jgi:hypothetical protein
MRVFARTVGLDRFEELLDIRVALPARAGVAPLPSAELLVAPRVAHLGAARARKKSKQRRVAPRRDLGVAHLDQVHALVAHVLHTGEHGVRVAVDLRVAP